jgi:hypothetical protein
MGEARLQRYIHEKTHTDLVLDDIRRTLPSRPMILFETESGGCSFPTEAFGLMVAGTSWNASLVLITSLCWVRRLKISEG